MIGTEQPPKPLRFYTFMATMCPKSWREEFRKELAYTVKADPYSVLGTVFRLGMQYQKEGGEL